VIGIGAMFLSQDHLLRQSAILTHKNECGIDFHVGFEQRRLYIVIFMIL